MNAETIHSLHHEIKNTVQHIRQQEVKLLQLLQEMDRLGGFRLLGYASLWEYTVEELKLTESQASAFISVSRRALQVKPFQQALEQGRLTVSQAKRITSVIHRSNAEEWIEKAQTYSQKELEREKFRVVEQVQGYLDPNMRDPDRLCRVTLALTQTALKQLQEAKELLGVSTLELAFEKVLDEYLDRKDPVRKAERAERKRERLTHDKNPPSEVSDSHLEEKRKSEAHRYRKEEKEILEVSFASFLSSHKAPAHPQPKHPHQHSSRNVTQPSRHIPANIQHQLHLRDRGRCQYRLPNGKLCASRRHIHLHHRQEVINGGMHTLKNLTTYCASHHRLHHFLEEMKLTG